MKKDKRLLNKIERIESYFTSENEHYDKYAFDLYKQAKENDLFTDLEIPLRLFSEYQNIFFTHREKPLQTSKKFIEVMKRKKLSNEQQVFILEHLISWFKGTVFTDDNGKEYSLNKIKELLEGERESLDSIKKTKPETANAFDWDKTKQHLATLHDTTEKIIYLILRKAEFQQQHGVNRKDREALFHGAWFDEQCEVEINTLEKLRKLEPQSSTPGKAKTQYKLSDKAGAKTDLIRILNALYELRLIQNTNGTYPTKESFMKNAGEIFGVDLQKYNVNLSQTFNGTLETNLKVFEEMIKKYTDEWTKRNK